MLAKAAAIALLVAGLGLACWLGLLIAVALAGGIGAGKPAALALHLAFLGLAFGALALGGVSGRRSVARMPAPGGGARLDRPARRRVTQPLRARQHRARHGAAGRRRRNRGRPVPLADADALRIGRDVRVGLEDATVGRDGGPASADAEQVARTVAAWRDLRR